MAPIVVAVVLKKLRRFMVEPPGTYPLNLGPRILWVSPRPHGEFLNRRLSKGKTREPSDVTRGRAYRTVWPYFMAASSGLEFGFPLYWPFSTGNPLYIQS
jgi:hypothetical protein